MHQRRRIFLAVLVLASAAHPAAAEPRVEAAPAYADVVRRLEPFIAREVADKDLPALSIALVDDQKIVWARGFGFADPKARKPASADTIYRVGSVSKLFTDIALMQLVERGAIDLDAPISRYLPDFKPTNPFPKAITLRMMLSHRSGLVREPPVGNYFDPTNPTLAKMVESLGTTKLVYEPEKRIKYSNGAIATAGYVLERTQKEPFAKYLQRTLLGPMGLKKSSFEPNEVVTPDLAKAVMWTYPGRQFPAPTFELGMAPAGSMYTTVLDLGRFLSILFADGKGPNGPILKPETLHKMYEPQFGKPGDKTGFGIGFYVTEMNGKRHIGHGGAVYGFATELAALPSDKLGVVVVTSRDGANAVTTHIADVALQQMLAVREKKPLPAIVQTAPIALEETRRLAGRYRSAKKKVFDLFQLNGKLWLIPARGGARLELRKLGDDLIVDDPLDYGTRLKIKDDTLSIGEDVYQRVEQPLPAPPAEHWLGLIGEYGWDHNTLVILEKDGKLQALIEWFFLYPLKEVSADVYEFPDFGLYHGEQLIFSRDPAGRASKVEAAKVVFQRRKLDGEDGSTFRIQPRRPIETIRKEAAAATPPRERGEFATPDLVQLVKLDDTIKLDIRYATANNFLSTPLYTSARAYMQKPAAEALVRAHRQLAKDGFGLLIFDTYRPWTVTKIFWDATPDNLRLFVADPDQGSRHNRGCAADLTLYDLKTGKPIDMVGGYDEMSDRSWPGYIGGTSRQRWHRDRLRRAMEAEHFTVYEAEWWHFDYKDWKKYPILNKTFEQLEAAKK